MTKAARITTRLAGALGLLLAAQAHAQDGGAAPSGQAQLEESAAYWEAHGHVDRAIEAWQRVLEIDPRSERAQAALVRDRGLLGGLDSDGNLPAGSPAAKARDLERQGLAEARALSRSGRYDEAVARYRAVFAARPVQPPEGFVGGAVGLEFYQTLAGTRAGLAEARAGIERLLAREPDCARCTVVLAEVLVYAEASRREGIDRLESLVRAGRDVEEATRWWRQGLGWLDARVADRDLYQRFLKLHPDDKAVAEKLAGIHDRAPSRPPGSPVVVEGWAALREGRTAAAEERFAHALETAPGDVDALVGLSSVRLSQERFEEARELAERAKRIAPERKTAWARPLATAEFWRLAHDADEARIAGDPVRAEGLARRAAARAPGPREDRQAKLRLAAIAVSADRDSDGERIYRGLIGRDAGDLDASRGLYALRLKQGRLDEATALAERLLASPALADADRAVLRIDLLLARARSESDRGNARRAIAILEEGLSFSPSDRGLRLALVYRLLDVGDIARARALAAALMGELPGDPEVLAAAAIVEVRDEHADEGRNLLERIDAARLPLGMRALKARLRLEARVKEALGAGSEGGIGVVERRLLELESEAATDEQRAIVAMAFARVGLSRRAITLALSVLSAHPTRAAKLRLAAALLVAREGSHLDELIAELEAEPRLDDDARRQIDDLKRGLAIQRADADRDANDYPRAFGRLEPLLVASPDDPAVLSSLARLYQSSGEPQKALDLYTRLLERDPGDLRISEAAAQAAVETTNARLARSIVAGAVARAPRDPQAWLIAARIARATDGDARAVDFIRRGLALLAGDAHRITADGTLVSAVPRPGGSDGSDGVERPSVADAVLRDARARFGRGASFEGVTVETASSTAARMRSAFIAEQALVDEHEAPQFELRPTVRDRSGEAGLGQLFQLSLPITVSVAPRFAGRFTLRVTPTYLTAGTTDLNNPSVAERYGSNGAYLPVSSMGLATAAQGGTLVADAAGVGFSLGWAGHGFRIEVGSTPLGFRLASVIGELGWAHRFGGLTVGVTAYRRPVMDSKLAFAGRLDNASGAVWGGVTRSGGALSLAWDRGAFGLWATAAYAIILGSHVADNHGGEYALGVVWRLARTSYLELSTGIAANGMTNDKNLSQFTLGQGGYFSPQLFFSGGVPLNVRVTRPDWKLRLEAEVGVNWFQEAASPYFPIDPALQALRSAQPLSSQTNPGAAYPARERAGAYGRLLLEGEHALSLHWFGLGGCNLLASAPFSEVICSLGLRGSIL